MIEFFYWRECPSYERALELLRETMHELGIGEDKLTTHEVFDDAEAVALGFPGSPTIRINGKDVQDPGDNPVGLSCRLYRHRDGRPSPLPNHQDLREALGAGKSQTEGAR